VAKGIIWAVYHGAHVISMSLGGTWPSSAQQDAMEYAWDKGAILIAAAGNNNTQSPSYPAYSDVCVAVGSTDSNDNRSSFSNYGDWVDVAAPGSFVYSTVPGGGYDYKSGTSMACPHVAGLAGLLFSRSGATNTSVRKSIENGTDPVGDWVIKGRVSVIKALGSTAPKPPPDSGGGGGGGGFGPKGFATTKGSAIASPKNSLVYSDGSNLHLRSTQSGKSRELDFYVKSKIAYQGTLENLKIVFEASFPDGPAEVTAYLYNWSTKAWDWIGKSELEHTKTRVEFTRKSPKAYVSGSGEVRAKFYSRTKWWTTFELKADYVRFVPKAKSGGGTKQEPPPPKDDPKKKKSVGDKAKDKWNKWKKKL
jgi:thermitase